MALFHVSPRAVLDAARYHFVSEQFQSAFELLRDSFDPEQVDNETIIKLLKGEAGLSGDGDEVTITNADDDDHRELCKEIMQNYDFLIQVDNKYYQVSSVSFQNFEQIATVNDAITALKAQPGALLPLRASVSEQSDSHITVLNNSNRLITELLSGIGVSAPDYQFDSSDFVTMHHSHLFFFEEFTSPFYQEFCVVYATPQEACQAFCRSQNLTIGDQ